MFDVSHKNLILEQQASERWRNRYLYDLEELVQSYTGPGYREFGVPMQVDPENHTYEYIALVTSQWTMDNPRVRMSTHLGGMAEVDTLALQYATNDWIREVNLRDTLESCAVDFAMKYAVAIVTREPRPGVYEAEDAPWWPQVAPLDLRQYGFDPAPYSRKQWRYQWHEILMDKEDLLRLADEKPGEGWNKDVIKLLDEIPNPYSRTKDSRASSSSDPDVPDRKMVRLIEMWVPEFQIEGRSPKSGYHGAILTIAPSLAAMKSGSTPTYPRDPKPWWGSRTGPYAFGGCYHVTGEAVPLGPIPAMKVQAQHLNDLVRATTAAIEDYKKIALVSSGDAKLAALIQESQHHGVYTANIDEVQKHIAQIELGGATQQHFLGEERARNMLDRNSGINDPQRGNVSGAATATEVTAAVGAGSSRMAYQILKFRGFVRELIEKAAWFIHNDTKYVANIAGAIPALIDGRTGQPIGKYKGGKPKSREATPFESIKVDIQVGSMERASETQTAMRMAAFDQTITMYAPAMAQMPWVKWNKVIAKRADLLDMPEMIEMFDTELAMTIAASTIGMEQGPEQKVASAQSPQPFMTQTLGPQSNGNKPPARDQPLDAMRKATERPGR